MSFVERHGLWSKEQQEAAGRALLPPALLADLLLEADARQFEVLSPAARQRFLQALEPSLGGSLDLRLDHPAEFLARWAEAETGRKRRYYALTAAGRKVLRGQKEQWQVVQMTLDKLWGLQHG